MEVININSVKLFNSFREHNFIGNEIDKYVIESVYIESKLTDWNISLLHTKILTYMVSKNDVKEYAKYLMYLKQSKPIKALNLNYQQIEISVNERINEIRGIINEIKSTTINK